MKNNTTLAVLLLFSVTIGLSCKKNSTASSTTVEYQITPMNNAFTKITYTDANGSSVVISDPAQLATGKKTITVTKPFAAKIETEINNVTTSTITYTLVISVDGQVKASQPASAPPSSITTASTQFNVQ